jgi:prepilin peptidase CpaA
VIVPRETAVFTTTLLFVAACVLHDVRTLRIPNRLTAPAMIAGVALNGWYAGWGGAQASLAGFGLATILLFGPFALGGVGAGDVKMMSAVGALLGPRLVLESLVIGMALGGVFAVVHLARIARFRETLSSLGQMIGAAVLLKSLVPLKVSATAANAVVLPYSLPLGLGTLGVIAVAFSGHS